MSSLVARESKACGTWAAHRICLVDDAILALVADDPAITVPGSREILTIGIWVARQDQFNINAARFLP